MQKQVNEVILFIYFTNQNYFSASQESKGKEVTLTVIGCDSPPTNSVTERTPLNELGLKLVII